MSSDAIEERFIRVRDFWLALLGIVVGGLTAYWLLTDVFRGFEPAIFAWLIAVAIFVAVIALAVKSPPVRTAAVAAALAYAASLAYATRNPLTVIERAQAIAGDRPYCIQVADGAADYRSAMSQSDFTGLTMRATGSRPSFQFHAVMAVGEGGDFDLYNWSYRKQDWMRLNTNGDHRTPVIRCQPRKDYVQRLPIFALSRSPGADTVPAYIGKRGFVIPVVYKAKLSHSGPGLYFNARSPDFVPVPDCGHLRDCLNDFVQVRFNPENMKSRLNREETSRVHEGDLAFGRITDIKCPVPIKLADVICRHSFVEDGVLFFFTHRESQLPQWREMQSKLLALYKSFQVQPAANSNSALQLLSPPRSQKITQFCGDVS